MNKDPKCMDCGLPYSEHGLDLILADQDWLRIAKKEDILCAVCICKRAEKIGKISLLAWMR
jgi:hypothetical protein